MWLQKKFVFKKKLLSYSESEKYVQLIYLKTYFKSYFDEKINLTNQRVFWGTSANRGRLGSEVFWWGNLRLGPSCGLGLGLGAENFEKVAC